MHSRASAAPGAILGLLSAALFGASTPFAKLLLGEMDPWLLAGLLYLGSGLGLAAVHLGRRSLGIAPPEAPLRRADLPWLAAVILAGGVAGPVLLMLGLSVTSASSAALLLNVEGLATMGIAWAVFRENADHRIVLGASWPAPCCCPGRAERRVWVGARLPSSAPACLGASTTT